jgi:hypothetical protein
LPAWEQDLPVRERQPELLGKDIVPHTPLPAQRNAISAFVGMAVKPIEVTCEFPPERKKAPGTFLSSGLLIWLRGQDLNLRPSGYEPDELPGCSTPRHQRFA